MQYVFLRGLHIIQGTSQYMNDVSMISGGCYTNGTTVNHRIPRDITVKIYILKARNKLKKIVNKELEGMNK